MGLLILRATVVLCLIMVATHPPDDLGDSVTLFARCLSLGVAVLLLVGFGTPIAAVSVTVLQAGTIALSHRFDPVSPIVAALGLALAMLGPGAWSLDARVFGRKRIV
jgi:putative oxidoreductase